MKLLVYIYPHLSVSHPIKHLVDCLQRLSERLFVIEENNGGLL